jgi:hypothetical protein
VLTDFCQLGDARVAGGWFHRGVIATHRHMAWRRRPTRLPRAQDRVRARIAPIGRRTGWRSLAALLLRLG